MRTGEIVQQLTATGGRGAGTDAERRAALSLARTISDDGRRTAHLEPFWCRPHWALAHAWHVALGLAGSLVAVSDPKLGAGMILVALLSVLADGTYGVSPGRRLTSERASQNVVSPATDETAPVQLILTANYDAGRAGLVYRNALRSSAASIHRLTRGRAPGWAGWLAIALLLTLATALLRVQGDKGAAVAIPQLLATIVLVIALALLLELGSSDWAPGAGDNATGVAVAITLARALDSAPPANASVGLVLGGAGDAQGIGLRRYLKARRRRYTPSNAIVLGIGPCGAGEPRWLQSDGSLIPLRFFSGLRRLATEVADLDPSLGRQAERGRGVSPALPARMRGLPAITLTALDSAGRVPRSHQHSDRSEALDHDRLDAVVQAGLLLVDAIDVYLGELRP